MFDATPKPTALLFDANAVTRKLVKLKGPVRFANVADVAVDDIGVSATPRGNVGVGLP
jgi:hypothetical protein